MHYTLFKEGIITIQDGVNSSKNDFQNNNKVLPYDDKQ